MSIELPHFNYTPSRQKEKKNAIRNNVIFPLVD